MQLLKFKYRQIKLEDSASLAIKSFRPLLSFPMWSLYTKSKLWRPTVLSVRSEFKTTNPFLLQISFSTLISFKNEIHRFITIKVGQNVTHFSKWLEDRELYRAFAYSINLLRKPESTASPIQNHFITLTISCN